ncbi:hypothetical protein WUBG_03461 [Wuchereria bancrofti]|uniref:Uncharacterized protein n=1 Tax=Wuchereria bancrofti TaxID=6293 RepID=J9F7Y6_WUCBA|nr:hypothetical protein WUBG_03461 [Wuchereria bancrofti]
MNDVFINKSKLYTKDNQHKTNKQLTGRTNESYTYEECLWWEGGTHGLSSTCRCMQSGESVLSSRRNSMGHRNTRAIVQSSKVATAGKASRDFTPSLVSWGFELHSASLI